MSDRPEPAYASARQALFENVFSQMHNLHTHWRMYVTFFGNREAVETVRASAKFTFGRLQALLIEAMVMGLARLLAPGKGRQGQRTASIDTLLRHMPEIDAALTRALRKRFEHVRADCQEISDWRNLVFAHRDYDVALLLKPLDRLRIRTVRSALTELSGLLTEASDRVGAALKFDFLPDNEADTFDADVLLEHLTQIRRSR